MNPAFSLSNILTEFKYSTRLALPLIASEVIYGLNNFIATIMVAHLGKEQLAANSLVWEISVAITVLFLGIFSAVSILVAQSYGAKDNASIGVCLKQGLILAIILAPPIMLILWFTPSVLILMKQDPVVISFAKPFFRSLIWSVLPLNIMSTMHQFLLGINKSRIVMVTSILAVPIEIFFYYVFLFGKFGFPQMGLAGLGYGLTASYSLISIYLFWYLRFSKCTKIYHLFNQWWRVNRKFLFELIRVGLPLGLMFFVECSLFAAVAVMMGILGTTALAANQIMYQHYMIALVVIFALTQNASVRVGNEVGRNNRSAIKLAAFVNLAITFGLISLFSFFYIVFPRLVISLDVNSQAPQLQELVKEASTFLAIGGILLLVDSLRLVSSGSLRGLKDTRFPMFVSILGFWGIAFPSAYLLAFKFKFGSVGILWGLVIGLLTSGIILFNRFNRLVKRIDLKTLVTKV